MKHLKIVLAALLLAGCTSPMMGLNGRGKAVKDLDEQVRAAEAVDAPKPAALPSQPLKFTGEFEVIAYDQPNARGRVKARHHVKNLVVDAGKAGVAGLINGVITNFFEHIAIGTGVTAAAAGDTACQTEISTGGGSRAAGTTSRVTTDVTNDTAQVEVTYNFTASFAVTEACLLDSITTGTLLARQVFSAINVASGDSLLVRYKLDVD